MAYLLLQCTECSSYKIVVSGTKHTSCLQCPRSEHRKSPPIREIMGPVEWQSGKRRNKAVFLIRGIYEDCMDARVKLKALTSVRYE